MSYDPRKCGARCDECPLRGSDLVPPETREAPDLIVLGESPGNQEVVEGKPFVGRSGKLLWALMKRQSVTRSDCHITNAVLCRPALGMTDKDWKTAIAACKPRLEAELPQGAPILVLGGKALQALTGHKEITKWRGAKMETEYGDIMPALHPAFVLRSPSYLPILSEDIKRVVHIARDEAPPIPTPAKLELNPSISTVEDLFDMEEVLGVDVECSGDSILGTKLLAVGLAAGDVAVSVDWGWASDEMKSAVRNLLESSMPKVMHNRQFDLLVLESHGMSCGGVVHDTLLMHTLLHPELPHNLGFVVSQYTHAPRWKTEFKIDMDGSGSAAFERAWHKNNEALLRYNALDTWYTCLVYKIMLREMNRAAQSH